MDRKTTGIIAIAATTMLCGLPGLLGGMMGALFAFLGLMPPSDLDINGSSDPVILIGLGLGILCFSLIGIAIPVLIAFLTFKKDESSQAEIPFDEPIPPAE